jgi:hypothetical protein
MARRGEIFVQAMTAVVDRDLDVATWHIMASGLDITAGAMTIDIRVGRAL